MPTAREMRVGLILALVLFWTSLTWMLYDQLMWAPGGSPAEDVYQLARKTVQVFWGQMVVTGFGGLALTRIAYGILRAPRQDG